MASRLLSTTSMSLWICHYGLCSEWYEIIEYYHKMSAPKYTKLTKSLQRELPKKSKNSRWKRIEQLILYAVQQKAKKTNKQEM